MVRAPCPSILFIYFPSGFLSLAACLSLFLPRPCTQGRGPGEGSSSGFRNLISEFSPRVTPQIPHQSSSSPPSQTPPPARPDTPPSPQSRCPAHNAAAP